MAQSSKKAKYCHCQKLSSLDELKFFENYSFCRKCGCILIKDTDEIIYYTLKPKSNRLPYDLNPISIIKNMKKKTEEYYPNIYEEFNINKIESRINKDKKLKCINLYLNHRRILLITLQKLIKIFDYSDKIFFQSLFFLDSYLSHEITEEFSEKKILYNLIGYFLCSIKLREDDISEPLLYSFCNIDKGIFLSLDKIAFYEIFCLKKINYNIFSFLLMIGFHS